jgi:hypothetical protein
MPVVGEIACFCQLCGIQGSGIQCRLYGRVFRRVVFCSPTFLPFAVRVRHYHLGCRSKLRKLVTKPPTRRWPDDGPGDLFFLRHAAFTIGLLRFCWFSGMTAPSVKHWKRGRRTKVNHRVRAGRYVLESTLLLLQGAVRSDWQRS